MTMEKKQKKKCDIWTKLNIRPVYCTRLYGIRISLHHHGRIQHQLYKLTNERKLESFFDVAKTSRPFSDTPRN